MPRAVRVSTPSRLHFGLLSFGRPDLRQFGGVGAMVDAPRLELTCRPAPQLEAHGPLASRALDVARSLSPVLGGKEPACSIEIHSAPPEHAGLGVGTQLALSVASGILTLLQGRPPNPVEIVSQIGRGTRSAVGTYGFSRGGLIMEAGKLPDESLAPLVTHVPLPASWRFVLVLSQEQRQSAEGLSGDAEKIAFENLPPVPEETSTRLLREIEDNMVPAAEQAQFEPFAASLYRYGHLAGSCFASRQGGVFASGRLVQLVERIRNLGVTGVGQSSWGPTLFTLFPNADEAEKFVQQLGQLPEADGVETIVTSPDNRGAQIEMIEVPANE